MDTTTPKLNVEFIYLPVINFAFQQNGVSIVRQLSVQNLTEEKISGIKIHISTGPDFGTAIPVHLESIAAGETIRIDSIALHLSADYFATLTERLSGNITLDISSGNENLYSEVYPIDILAYDQWNGVNVLPEMLAAFITPNHPTLVPILQRAAGILEQWTGNPSLDEYQSRNPDRVRKQMAAVYAAIAEQQIIYSTVPASFEESGQRIRLADTVMTQKLGTCLDMAILYASCLEAIGINSLVVFVNGHAFSGGWLVPETFPDSVIDDVSYLTKRTADGINDIVLVETTSMNMGKNHDFDGAVASAVSRCGKGDFIFALDVQRARTSGIRPVPQRVLNNGVWTIKYDEQAVESIHNAPQAVNRYDLSGLSEEVTLTKQLLWERKLLDLSLRNNLLNIRITKNTLQFISADLHLFEDALADGDEFRVMHKPTDWENKLYDFGIYHILSESDPVMELIRSEIAQKRLRSYLTETELGKAMTHLYRSSRTSMEENGANTLYLALGLLKWYETPASERPRFAPLLLVPVEIIRKSASMGYVIRSREEETMMNITLLEMLRQNFNINIPGLTPLPTDESGVNVKLIFSIIRNGIKNQPLWDVEEQAILGIFSFNKFTMWNDIHSNSDKLAQNKVVSSLMSGKIEWDAPEVLADASELDKHLSPSEVVLPVSADSSQLEAIYEAANGTSFILHGPPGTGKSQTITNLIANALYRGKRVLFVAEKMAALSVVQKRLDAIGLGPFCLELHSNKTKKTAILSQLRETCEVSQLAPPEDFKAEADRLMGLRSDLNGYVEALHKDYPFGLSLYEAITRYESLPNGESLFEIPVKIFAGLTQDILKQWEEAIEYLVRTANACGHPYNHPLTGITVNDYSLTIKERAAELVSGTLEVLENIKPALHVLTELFGEYGKASTKKEIEVLSGLINSLLTLPELTSAMLKKPMLDSVLEECRETCSHGIERDRLKSDLLRDFSEGVLSLDGNVLLTEWNRATASWFLPRFFGQQKVIKQLKAYSAKNIKEIDIKSTLERLIAYMTEKQYTDTHAIEFPTLFGKFGRRENEDWNTIDRLIDDTSALNRAVMELAGDIAASSAIKELLSSQLTEGITPFRAIYANRLHTLSGFFSDLVKREHRLSAELGVTSELLYQGPNTWIENATGKLKRWNENIDSLKDWYQWQLATERMEALNLGFVADRYKDENIETSRLSGVFMKSVYKAAAEYIISQDKSLEMFNGRMFSDVIDKYKRMTEQFQDLTRKELVARLASNLPSFTREAAQNSEVGILQRNLRNNARGITVRRLFDQIPTLLSRMCPCMLMSPISVAQYIDADAEKFDLVVFDEASQMPTYEAVGAIARGKSVVVVGDPKQMPPTSFFATNTVDEDNIEMEDLDSILEDCLALSMPSSHLLWHYRSKHESLIAFSNSEYYENKLLTFPSPDNIESKVSLVHIDGAYDKGKTRQNRAEAQAVVDEIARRLADEELKKKSIGVVTFSAVQQSLIEDMLSELFVTNPDIETYALECEEPLFIKNLENVQGDERDVILFSVGYGPDKEGKVSMNFGPLNREGGERRLNVAVSRARYEMIIYSTLSPDQIDLRRTSSVGVAGLKRFLEYAAKGERIVHNTATLAESEISIHSVIAAKLREEGLAVHTNIGSSGYRIDMGIVDVQDPSRYKLAIICDGDNYKRTKTMRDREIVQGSVLKMLGWNICRIWTMDWWENPQRVIDSIKQAMEEADMLPEPEKTTPEPTPVKTADNDDHIEASVEPDIQPADTAIPYRQAILSPVRYPSEEFLNPAYRTLISTQIRAVIETEAPVSRTLLCKRVLSAWGIARLGQRLDTYFDELLRQGGFFRSTYEGLVFYWPDRITHDKYDRYRIDSGRDAVDLPPPEVANVIRHLLQNEISLPTTDLSKICAQTFGFARTGTNVDAAMMRGIEYAIKRGYIRVENGRAVIV